MQRQGQEKGHWFEGYVHFVRLSSVGLRFNEAFRGHVPASSYNIRFKLNRIPLRRQHEALASAFNPERILFPKLSNVLAQAVPQAATMAHLIYNRLIVDNQPQLQAVTSMCHLPAGSPPFIVFGP